ncbi:MAG: hypothetical protein V7636_562 [Actinomycetota bacterium]
MSRFVLFVVVALVAMSLFVATPAAADDAPVAVSYVPPVDAPVVDEFRPPQTHYGPGNRGIDYDVAPGDVVRAAADGVVVFAGRIGSSSHVVVLHDDGIRTSYSFLAEVDVRRGAHIHQGDAVGVAGGEVHFGARAGNEYLDPTSLFGGGPPKVHLVPTDLRAPQTEAQERHGVLDSIRGLGANLASHAGAVVDLATPVGRLVAEHGWELTRTAIDVAADDFGRLDEALRAAGHAAHAPLTHADRAALRMQRVIEDQRDCTPDDVPDPVAPASGHLLVLVGGRNSSTTSTPLLHLDTRSLGYADDDVTLFSYAGGTRPYDAHDTHGDLADTGATLRARLQDIARRHPGVTVDLVAHSQGGLVVRAALTGADTWAPDLPVIGTIATIDTPHHGAIPATADAILGTPVGGNAARDMSAASHLISRLDARGLPANTNVVSIAGSGDLVVDAQASAIDHAANAVVRAEGIHAHDQVVTLPATHRELALALAGQHPACRAAADLQHDLVLADDINLANGVRWVADRADHLLHLPAAPGGNGPPG